MEGEGAGRQHEAFAYRRGGRRRKRGAAVQRSWQWHRYSRGHSAFALSKVRVRALWIGYSNAGDGQLRNSNEGAFDFAELAGRRGGSGKIFERAGAGDEVREWLVRCAARADCDCRSSRCEFSAV